MKFNADGLFEWPKRKQRAWNDPSLMREFQEQVDRELRKLDKDHIQSWPAGFADLKLKDGVYQ